MQQDQTTTAKLIKRFRSFRYSLVLQGIAVGFAAGMVAVLFRVSLEQADAFRQSIGIFLSAHPWAVSLWMLALLGIGRLGNAASPRRTVHQWLWHPAGGRGNARRALADLVAGVAGKIYRRDPDHRRRTLPGPRRALHPDGRYGGKRRVPVIPSRQD